MKVGNNYIDQDDFLLLYSDTEYPFTKDNTYSGFAGTGVKPLNFNPECVLSNLTFQLRTPTSPLVEELISSAFQSPQNIMRQLDRKVRSTQNSFN